MTRRRFFDTEFVVLWLVFMLVAAFGAFVWVRLHR
jgi:hypothetical protein